MGVFNINITIKTGKPRGFMNETTALAVNCWAEAIRTTVVPISGVIRTTVVPISGVIRTTVVPISGVIRTTVVRIANATGIGYRHDGSIRFSYKLTNALNY